MILMAYTATYIPFKTAFIDYSSDLITNIELSIDGLFILDILINFLSAYENKEKNIEFKL